MKCISSSFRLAIDPDLTSAEPDFAEALRLLHKGENAVLWMPAKHEAIVYQIELVDIISPPPVAARRSSADGRPADRKAPAARVH